jgi:hypothetical protein
VVAIINPLLRVVVQLLEHESQTGLDLAGGEGERGCRKKHLLLLLLLLLTLETDENAVPRCQAVRLRL